MDYKVQLDMYNGPLDLLLFLIRREEVDIYDIPIARIAEQYAQYVELLKALDPNMAGDFLVMLATLVLIKSQTLLPNPPPDEDDEDSLDPRAELVRQLLEYKRFKDAAQDLGLAAELQALKYDRVGGQMAADEHREVELEDLHLWDLLEAFNRLMAQVGHGPVSHDVIYDDTPIALHAADLLDRLARDGSLSFAEIFAGRSRSEMVGLFLALLEAIRQRRVRIEQDEPLGPIYVHLLDATPLSGISDESPGTLTMDDPEREAGDEP
jgi:segregation and condensation protein A